MKFNSLNTDLYSLINQSVENAGYSIKHSDAFYIRYSLIEQSLYSKYSNRAFTDAYFVTDGVPYEYH